MNIFKISLPGQDVRGARLNEEVVDSIYPSPKVSTIASPPHAGIIHLNWSSSIILPNPTVKNLYSFAHGYNQIPSTLAVFSFDNGTTKTNGILPFNYGALGLILIDADSTNVNLKYISFDLASTVIPVFIMQVRFYVFAERGYA
jgi:hypothetical protein